MSLDQRQFTFEVNEAAGAFSFELPSHISGCDIKKFARHEDASKKYPFVISGADNHIYAAPDALTDRLRVVVKGDRNRIFIGSKASVRGYIGIQGHDRNVFIGSRTTFNDVNIICKQDGNVVIGRDCMFSEEIEIRTSDGHCVIDLEKMQVTNKARGVYIGDHVWIGKRTAVQKGSYVASDNIIAMGSYVNGVFRDESAIIAGTPAKVVRTAKTWSRRGSVDFARDNIFSWKRFPLL